MGPVVLLLPWQSFVSAIRRKGGRFIGLTRELIQLVFVGTGCDELYGFQLLEVYAAITFLRTIEKVKSSSRNIKPITYLVEVLATQMVGPTLSQCRWKSVASNPSREPLQKDEQLPHFFNGGGVETWKQRNQVLCSQCKSCAFWPVSRILDPKNAPFTVMRGREVNYSYSCDGSFYTSSRRISSTKYCHFWLWLSTEIQPFHAFVGDQVLFMKCSKRNVPKAVTFTQVMPLLQS